MEVLIALAPYIVGLVGAVTGIGGLVVSNRKSKADEKAGVSEQESTLRRDTISDRDALINQFQEEMTELRRRVSNLERALDVERRHSIALEDHIYRGNPPPPPVRPEYTPT